MRVVITGASGQIGTNLALALMARGDQVEGIDRRTNTWDSTIPIRQLDLRNADPEEVLEGPRPDVVVHLAANAKVYELVEHPDRAMDNIRISFTVLEYCRRHKVPLVFSSSREVYGDIHRHVTEEDQADFVVAESPYSASKISAEALIYSYRQCYDLPYLVFRFSNVYGRFDCDLDRMERVIPLFIRKIARDEPITVFGKQKVLDFTYVDDCTNGLIRGIDRLVSGQVQNATINLAHGQGNTLADLVNLIGLALRKTPSATYEPTRAGEVTRYVADITMAREQLGYEPTIPLTAGLPLAIAWQREAGHLSV